MSRGLDRLVVVLCALFVGTLLSPLPSLALDPAVADRQDPTQAEATPEEQSEDHSEQATAAAAVDAGETSSRDETDDPCQPNGAGEAWLDVFQQGIFRTVCHSARWFDGFFGDARFDDGLAEPWGRLSVDTLYDESEELEVDVSFRAEVDFPNLDHRIDAFLGRDNDEDFVSGRDLGNESLPELFRAEDREWLFGLGYRPLGRRSNRFDIRVGVKIRFPLEPFVQGRFKRHWLLSDTRLVRFRNTAFWRNQQGFGNTVNLDVEQAFARPFFLRWTGSATLSERAKGIDWGTSLTLFQDLGDLRAFAHTLFIDGETENAVPVERYGFRTIYRQQIFREWFFGQVIAGVNFPREPGESRETSWQLGVGFEIRYGRKPRAH